MNPMDQFVAATPSDIIDRVREEAARCCEETAKWQRGERGELRQPRHRNDLLAEFSDDAFGVAGEVAMIVGEAFKKSGARFRVDVPWDIAARMLRSGWQRNHKLLGHVVNSKEAS